MPEQGKGFLDEVQLDKLGLFVLDEKPQWLGRREGSALNISGCAFQKAGNQGHPTQVPFDECFIKYLI